MAMSGGSCKGEINVTPMIDILLVLLIIFMVIQPPYSTGLDTAVPQDAPPGAVPAPARDALIEVRSNGTIQLNHAAIDASSLDSRLRELYKRTAEIAVFIRADTDVDFEQVAEVIDTAQGIGIKKVGLMPR